MNGFELHNNNAPLPTFFGDDFNYPLYSGSGVIADDALPIQGNERLCIDPSLLELGPSAASQGDESNAGDGSVGLAEFPLLSPYNHVLQRNRPTANPEMHHPTFERAEHISGCPPFADTQHTYLSQPPSQQLSHGSSTSPGLSSQIFSNSSEVALSDTPLSTHTQSLSNGQQKPGIQIPRAPTLSCIHCSRICGTQKALQSHLANKHRYSCQFAGCNKTFDRIKTRNRHYRTKKHKDERDAHSQTEVYLCHCGKEDPRKDNHRRHLKNCKRTPIALYQCECGWQDVSREEHDTHLKSCKPKKD